MRLSYMTLELLASLGDPAAKVARSEFVKKCGSAEKNPPDVSVAAFVGGGDYTVALAWIK